MNKNLLSFALGSLVGAGIGWFLSKRYYNQQLEDSISSIRDIHVREIQKLKAEQARNKPDLVQTTDFREEVPVPEMAEEESPSEDSYRPDPYFINEEEYGVHNSYDKLAARYYVADDIFTDLEEYPMDVREYLSAEILDKIRDEGYDGTDACYIRNEAYGIDMEIEKIVDVPNVGGFYEEE